MKKLSFLVMLFTFSFNTASAQMWKLKVDHECIPKDFDPEKFTLLVMHLPNRGNPQKTSKYATKGLRKAFEENYPYKFEIVTPEQLRTDSVKYSDTSVYRFLLLNSFTTTPRVDGGYRENLQTGVRTPNAPQRVQITTIDFSFYDLTTETQYRFLGSLNSYVAPTVKSLVKAINEVSGRTGTKN